MALALMFCLLWAPSAFAAGGQHQHQRYGPKTSAGAPNKFAGHQKLDHELSQRGDKKDSRYLLGSTQVIATLKKGAHVNFKATVKVTATGPLTATAQVSGAQPDPNPSNNTSSSSITAKT